MSIIFIMRMAQFLLSFFCIFFFLQLIFGQGGIISLIHQRRFVKSLESNIKELRSIDFAMQRQVTLAHTNDAYMRMNAHRVGLLAEDEYFIRLQYPFFNTIVSYSPGKVIQPRKNFYISPYILFFAALTIYFLLSSLQLILLRKTAYKREDHYNELPLHDTLRSHAST